MLSKQINYKTMKKAFPLSKLIIVTIFLACLNIYSFGQQTRNYLNNWYFGDAAGVSFNSGAPTNITSNITAYEISTSYSDGAGNTLFYAGANNLTTSGNGFTVWDASHNTMPNGDVSIDYSSSCGLTTAPVPGNCDQFYVFHLTSTGPGWGVHASLIDMTLPGNGTGGLPLGDVVSGFKDSVIYGGDNLAEKLKIVQQGNTENYWVIARSLTADLFYSFEVSAAGINTTPIVSTISAILYPSVIGSPNLGWLAVNKDRNTIAESLGLSAEVKLYDFNNLTGVLSLTEVVLSTGGVMSDIPYGAEFSPSGNVLYISWYDGVSGAYISSFDMTVGAGFIAATRQDYLIANSGNAEYGALTKGPDSKIYGPRFGFTSMLSISTPENHLAPTINISGYDPSPGSAILGMPNNTYYYHPDNFIDTLAGNDRTGSCSTYQTEIGAIGYDSIWANYSWSPAVMLVGSSDEASPQTVNLTADQEYILHVIHECGDTIISDTVMVMVGVPLAVSLNTNSPICENQLLSLSAFPSGLGAGSYSWVGPNGPFGGAGLSNVDIIPFGSLIAGGWYYVTVDSSSCIGIDSAFVISNSTYNIFDTIAICSGTNYTYADGTISNNIIVDESHISSLTTAESCDSIVREFLAVGTAAAPTVSNDTTYCENELFADMTCGGSNVNWYSDNSLTSFLGAGATYPPLNTIGTTTYYVTAGLAPCVSPLDSVVISIIAMQDAGIDGVHTFCPTDLPYDLFSALGGTPTIGGVWSPTLASTTGIFDPTIDTAGTYQYILLGTGPCANDTAEISVTVYGTPNAGTNGSLDVCSSSTSTDLLNSLGGSPDPGGVWFPALSGGGGIFDPSFDGSGTYQYTIAASGSCPDATADVIVTVTNAPNAGINSTAILCANGNTFIAVDSVGGSPDLTGDWLPTLTGGIFDSGVNGGGAYTYTVTGVGGCPNSVSILTVILNSIPIVNLGGISTYCQGDSLLLDAGNMGSTYLWSPSGNLAQTEYVSTAGNYSVNVTDANGCIGTSSIAISEQVVPNLNIIGDTTLCIGEPYMLITDGSGSLVWNTTETNDTIMGSPSVSGWFWVSNTNSCGAQTDSLYLTVNPIPNANAGNDTIILPLETLTLSATGGVSYLWSPPLGLSCTSCPNPIVDISSNATYCVSVTDINGCNNSDCLSILIDTSGEVWTPNIFSANGDGLNDVFYVRGPIHPENFTLIIYSRWGEKIFETTDPTLGWDGTFRGKPLNSAVFAYLATGSTIGGAEFELKGNITLIVK
jgi:gliding motility-associated-like protein